MTHYQFECWKRKMRKADERRLVNCEGYVSAYNFKWYESDYDKSFWWK